MEWTQNFQNFIQDIGRRPTKEYSIERIDNNGDYNPLNCKWAKINQQARNTSRNRTFTYLEKTQCAKDWANEYHINYSTFLNRLKAGYLFREALTTTNEAS